MALPLDKSLQLTPTFNQLFPGAHSNLRTPMDADKLRIFQRGAKDAVLQDIDGNRYIDYMGALGPNILGHCHPEYVQSLQDFLQHNSVCGGAGVLFSEDDIAVAEKIIKHVPCAERVKFSVTGSEAVQLALRLARAYTGRRYYLRFGGHYHGWFDNIYGGMPAASTTEMPFAVNANQACEGIFPDASQQGLMIPWNDLEALETTLERYGQDIAVIHLEALPCNYFALQPRAGFLERLRELCDHYGIVLSFDEIITGFRLGLGGAQGHFGVTPDIATLGKALGGGLPVSAVVGKADILDQLKDNRVVSPGTFNGNPLCVHAVKTTLEILERDDGAAYRDMARVQQGLMDGLSEIARRHGIPMRIQGATGVFYTLFGVDPDQPLYTEADLSHHDPALFDRFWNKMAKAGVYILLGARWYSTLSHTDQDTQQTLELADKVMATL